MSHIRPDSFNNTSEIKSDLLYTMINLTNKMLELKSIQEVYNYAGDFLSTHISNSIIILNHVIKPNEIVKTVGIFGVGSEIINKVQKITGFDYSKKKYILSSKHVRFINSEKLVEFSKGLYDFAQPELSKTSAQIIETILSINKIYTIGITNNFEAFASMHIFTLGKSEIVNTNFIELFVKQVGIVIQQKKYLEIINDQNNELQKLNHIKEKILSIIGHDLRSPFLSISGFSDILLKKVDDDNLVKIITSLKTSSNQANEILQSLLNWAKSQTEKTCIRLEIIDIQQIAASSVDFLQIIAERKKLEIINNIPQKTTVCADENLLKTIFRNLLSNAIKYSFENSRIEIRCEFIKGFVIIKVVDSGVGINKEGISALLNGDLIRSTTGTSNEKGTGLGLMICKEFTELMNGQFSIESLTGKGSIFSITLPLA